MSVILLPYFKFKVPSIYFKITLYRCEINTQQILTGTRLLPPQLINILSEMPGVLDNDKPGNVFQTFEDHISFSGS